MSKFVKFLPEKNAGDGLLPWLIAVMLFLFSVAFMTSTAIGSGIGEWTTGLGKSLSVQVVESDPIEMEAQTEAALKMLKATPGIASAEVMANSEVLTMLKPWLGDLSFESAELPIPTLIKVEMRYPGAVNTEALAERLKATAPGAALDDHQAWLSQILDIAAAVRGLLIAVLIMVTLTTIAIVIFGCRAGLATHRESIEIMHLMGAEDKMIAKAFDQRYFWHGVKGGMIGVVLGAVVLYAIGQLADAVGQGLVHSISPSEGRWFWLLGLPVMAALLAMMTARITVRRALLKMM